MEKIRIRDKQPGSATLSFLQGLRTKFSPRKCLNNGKKHNTRQETHLEWVDDLLGELETLSELVHGYWSLLPLPLAPLDGLAPPLQVGEAELVGGPVSVLTLLVQPVLRVLQPGLPIKNPPQKKPTKIHLKKPTKNVFFFFFFFNFLIFY